MILEVLFGTYLAVLVAVILTNIKRYVQTRTKQIESCEAGNRIWFPALVKRAPGFELMPDEKLIHQGFIIQRVEMYYGLAGKVRDGYLTSNRLVVCRKFFERLAPGVHIAEYIFFYMIELPLMNRKSKKIVFEFPLADVLKFEILNEPDRPWYEMMNMPGSHWCMFELRDGRKYIVNFRFLAGGPKLPWGPEDRWVAAIRAALQSVQRS